MNPKNMVDRAFLSTKYSFRM